MRINSSENNHYSSYSIVVEDTNPKYNMVFTLIHYEHSKYETYMKIIADNYKCYGVDVVKYILPFLEINIRVFGQSFNKFKNMYPEYSKQITRYQMLL